LVNANAPLDVVELVLGKTIVECKRYRLQPELRSLPITFDMDVPRFNPI